MFLRILNPMLQWLRQIESRKQILTSHESFCIEQAHDFIDTNNDGNISVSELQEVLSKYHIDETSLTGLKQLIETMNKDPDMEISLSKFKEYVTPILKHSGKSYLPR